MPSLVITGLLTFAVCLATLQGDAKFSSKPTCLYNWLRKAGVPPRKAARYEKALRAGRVSEKTLQSGTLSPFLLSFALQGDFKSALALKNCITRQSKHCRGYNPCQRGGECVFRYHRRINTCTCRQGLFGDLCQEDCNECTKKNPSQCTGLHHNCNSNAYCKNTRGSFRCLCQNGFNGDGRNCSDVDECQNRPCGHHANCKNTFGSYTCTCFSGYHGNGKVCQPIDECLSKPCQNGGTCTDHTNRYTCHCAVGYEGSHCQNRWLRTDLHKPLPDMLWKVTKAVQNLTEEMKDVHRLLSAQGKMLTAQQKIVSKLRLGKTRQFAAASCKQVYLLGQWVSGLYWIKSSRKSPKEVFCDMTAGGGWMRVVHIDAKKHRCPAILKRVSSPVHVCALDSHRHGSRGCASTVFTSHGVAYSEVRGYAYGYQFRSPDAFYRNSYTIDQPYVDGISITHGSPRQHVWTFAIGITKDGSIPESNCPCSQHPGKKPPVFVANDFYCESGNSGTSYTHVWYKERLWDGRCYKRSNCCARSGMPFFVKPLHTVTTDPLEVRLCQDQNTRDENTGVEKMEIFVR